jgi:predicted restriction endonuclease
MLRASHIKSWKQSTDAEKLDENNGLLLCAHHDALFDKHLITFDNSGNVQISPTLSTQEQMDLGLTTLPSIAVTPAMLPYLAVHQSKLRG